jgi:hypothetical protein
MLRHNNFMKPPLMETNKIPGVQYALSTDGIELPVVDVTHPAFSLTLTDPEQRTLVEESLQEKGPFARLPSFLRNALQGFFLRGSMLADGIRHAQGTFLSGMHTHLLKLGPNMLGSAYAKPIDRRIAASLPVLAVRLRLQDVATLMAEALLPVLVKEPSRPLHLLNIAGGPAIDSLNALILLTKKQLGVLAGREITVDVLDLDEAGPTFGARALPSLSQEGGALSEVRVAFRHVPYNWSKASDLKPILGEARAREALAICSSEGGLFEYGSDTEIEENLTLLRAFPEVLAVVGSVTRGDEPVQRIRKMGRAATRPRGLGIFRALIEKSGWKIARAIERPFSDQVVLT